MVHLGFEVQNVIDNWLFHNGEQFFFTVHQTGYKAGKFCKYFVAHFRNFAAHFVT
jgi:hypothetical protein